MVQIGLENLHAEIVVELEQDFKQQAVKAQNIPIRADVVGDLHLPQRFLESVQLGLPDGVRAWVVQDEPKLLHIRDIQPDKIHRDLKHDPDIRRGAFCRMDHTGIDQEALPFQQAKGSALHGDIQFSLNHVNDFDGVMPVVGEVASMVNICKKADSGCLRNLDHFINMVRLGFWHTLSLYDYGNCFVRHQHHGTLESGASIFR